MNEASNIDGLDVPTQVAIVKIEGNISRILDSQTRQSADMANILNVQIKHSEILASLSSLNVQERLVAQRDRTDAIIERVAALELVNAMNTGERKGVTLSAKILYGVCAFFGLSGLAVIVRVFTHGSI